MQARSRRRNPFRPLLLTAGAIVVLGVAGYVVLAAALDPNKLRADLQEAVRRQTGRELTVAGGVHLTFGLSPQFVVEDVALANLPGGSRPQMLTARSIRAQLALLPLLGGDAVISALTVEQPNLLLEKTADGTPNWQFVAEHRALYQSHGGSGGGGSHHVQIEALTLHGGQVSWRPAQGDPLILGIGRLEVAAQSTDLPMTLSFEGTHDNVPVTANASSGSLQRLQGGPVSALAGTWPLTVDVASQGATVHLTGGINHPDQGPRLFLPRDGRGTGAGRAGPAAAGYQPAAALGSERHGRAAGRQPGRAAHLADLGARPARPTCRDGWPGLSVKQATLSAPGPGQLIQLNVDGTYQDQPLRVAANSMQPDVVGNSSGPMQVMLSAQAAGATLQARGTMPPRLGASGLDMMVSLKAPDLSALSSLAGRTLPAAQNLTADAQIGDAGVKLRGIMVRNLGRLLLAGRCGRATDGGLVAAPDHRRHAHLPHAGHRRPGAGGCLGRGARDLAAAGRWRPDRHATRGTTSRGRFCSAGGPSGTASKHPAAGATPQHGCRSDRVGR